MFVFGCVSALEKLHFLNVHPKPLIQQDAEKKKNPSSNTTEPIHPLPPQPNSHPTYPL